MGDRPPRLPPGRKSDATFWRRGAWAQPGYWSPRREPWWPLLPGWQRAVLKAAPVALGWGWLNHWTATITVLLVSAAAFIGFLAWRAREFRPVHHFRWVRPARRAVTTELGVPPAQFKVARNREEVTIGLPPDRVLDANAQKSLEYVVAERLAICAAPTWKQHGGAPSLILHRVEPPPSDVAWADLEADVDQAERDQLVVGVGADRKIVKASLTQDSPHFAISMGSGAGKSNLVAFWLLQELRRGAVALILDAKWMSHSWLFKDMAAEYGQLPCVRYCRRTEDLHNALCWLDGEIERRSQVADRINNTRGDALRQLGTVGPRLWVVAEEMNMAADRLKDYWAGIRQKGQPARSPAFKGFSATSQAGRALDVHMIAVAQQMTAASVGGGAVRENFGVRCLSRYTLNSWRMLCGDLPMPPSVTAPGRVQCVTGPDVDEAQTPLMDLEEARDLVLASDMTPAPAGMPGIASDVLSPTVLPANVPALVGAEQGIVVQQPSRPPGTMTLREAVEAKWWPTIDAARQARQRAKPEEMGMEGPAALYRVSDLAAIRSSR